MTRNSVSHKSLKVMCKCALLTMALLLFAFMSPDSGISAETTLLTIIHSGNVNGYIFPCPT